MRLHARERALCFDDILLIPQEGRIESRADVDISTTIGVQHRSQSHLRLSVPIVAAPMDTVCDEDMVQALDQLGALGVMHRYMPRQEIIAKTARLHDKGLDNIAVSVSTKDVFDKQYIHELDHAGANVFCIDTANGHSSLTIEATQELRSKVFDTTHIMVGNVSTLEGFIALLDAGADSVRVGIGGGSACSTRIVSGHGAPLLWSIQQCVGVTNINRSAIIADGGIRNTGDMVKAFAAGAGAVMVGSLLAGHDESPAIYDDQGRRVYRGMASGAAQEAWRGRFDSEEGVVGSVPERGPVEKTIKEIRYGIASGCSYSGVLSLRDLHKDARYIEVSDLTVNESRPRI